MSISDLHLPYYVSGVRKKKQKEKIYKILKLYK